MRRGRSRLSKADAAGGNAASIPQLDWHTVERPWGPLEVLSKDQLETIHNASMQLLENAGVEVMSPRARQLFKQAGAQVDQANDMVRMDRNLVAELLAHTPAEFTLTPRNSQRSLHIGGSCLNFGMVSGPPNVHDCLNGRRAGNFEDFCKLIKLGQSFNIVHFFGNQTLAPIDLPANTRHLDSYFCSLTLSDKIFSAIPIGGVRVRDAIEMVAIARGETPAELAHRPGLIANVNINSPRKLDAAMSDGIIAIAEAGQAIIVTPFTLMGAMSPVTPAGAYAQQNAEALLGICLAQIVNPGTPSIYGGFTSNVDMKSGAPAFGTPENARANLVGAQLARRYGLPHRTSACNASNAPDAQAVYETQMALWGACVGGGHLIYHAAGWLEGGLVASFEKFIIDVEMLQAMSQLFAPTDVSTASLALDTTAAVQPGGHFFGQPHTLERYKTAFYQPLLSDWRNYESWLEAGGLDATARATVLWQQALREYQPPPLDPAIKEALEAYVTKRKQSIGSKDI